LSSQRRRSRFSIFATISRDSSSSYVIPAASPSISTMLWSGVGAEPPTVSSPPPISSQVASRSPQRLLDYLNAHSSFLKRETTLKSSFTPESVTKAGRSTLPASKGRALAFSWTYLVSFQHCRNHPQLIQRQCTLRQASRDSRLFVSNHRTGPNKKQSKTALVGIQAWRGRTVSQSRVKRQWTLKLTLHVMRTSRN
jgi:hypothetical protein